MLGDEAIILGVVMAARLNLILAFCQLLDSVFFSRGFFDIPAELYAIEYGTLVGDLRHELMGTTYFIRPSGFYSEPSALSAFGLFLFLVGTYAEKLELLVVSLLLILISMSLSGIVFLALIASLYAFFKVGIFSKAIIRSNFRYGIILALLTSIFVLGERLESIVNGDDLSSFIRIEQPLKLIVHYFSFGQYFGENKSALLSLASSEVESIFDNWYLNQVMMYGLFGFVLMVLSYKSIPFYLYLIFTAFCIMNGDPYYYDRALLLILSILVVRSSKEAK